MSRPHARQTRRPDERFRDLALVVGLIVLSWVHRLAFLFSNRDRDWPFTIFYEGDSEAFHLFARAILAGVPYDGGIPFHPPGFAYFLAGLHALFGAGAANAQVPYLAIKIAMALLGSVSVGLIYLVARSYLGRAAALCGALLCVHHFGLYVLAVAPLTEGLFLASMLLALLLWTRLAKATGALGARLAQSGALGVPPALAVALGSTLAGLILVRAEGSLVAALLLTLGAIGSIRGTTRVRRPSTSWGPWAMAAGVCVLALVPNLLANHRALENANRALAGRLAEPLPTWIPVTLYGPLNLALANHAGADGTFSRDHLPGDRGGRLDLTRGDHLSLLLHGDRDARAWITANPEAFLRLVVRKVGIFVGALRLGWTQWNLPGGLVGVRRPVDVFVPDRTVNAWFLGPVLLLSFVAAWRVGGLVRRWAELVALLTVASLATAVCFFGYARQGLLLVPLWLTLLGYGCVRVATSLFAGRIVPGDVRMKWGTAGVLGLLLVLELWGATRDRDYEASGENVVGESYLNRDRPVRLRPLP